MFLVEYNQKIVLFSRRENNIDWNSWGKAIMKGLEKELKGYEEQREWKIFIPLCSLLV